MDEWPTAASSEWSGCEGGSADADKKGNLTQQEERNCQGKEGAHWGDDIVDLVRGCTVAFAIPVATFQLVQLTIHLQLSDALVENVQASGGCLLDCNAVLAHNALLRAVRVDKWNGQCSQVAVLVHCQLIVQSQLCVVGESENKSEQLKWAQSFSSKSNNRNWPQSARMACRAPAGFPSHACRQTSSPPCTTTRKFDVQCSCHCSDWARCRCCCWGPSPGRCPCTPGPGWLWRGSLQRAPPASWRHCPPGALSPRVHWSLTPGKCRWTASVVPWCGFPCRAYLKAQSLPATVRVSECVKGKVAISNGERWHSLAQSCTLTFIALGRLTWL